MWSVKVVGTWSVCGRYVVGMWSVRGRYVVGNVVGNVVGMWSVDDLPTTYRQFNLFHITVDLCMFVCVGLVF